MDEKQIREAIDATLQSIAPELEPSALQPGKPLRTQVDLDSYDWLNFLLALHERLKVEIPESDYAQLTTLDALVAYLKARMG